MTIKTKETPPNPERLIEALRDTGYNFETAIADIIDNSISAYASEINVVAEMKSDGSKNIYVVDNGHGMSSEELELAMTYGADERPDDKSLGKFGLGLKTASTSQCRSFSVVSRRGSDEMACSAKWDLDHVAATNSWQLILDIPDQTKLDQLKKKHDAILIATGVYKPREINLPGNDLENIFPAMEFLTASNKKGLGDKVELFDKGILNAEGKDVVVIGGGDTAMDCVRTSIRQKAKSVKCLYRRDKENMPGSAREVYNAEEEGVEFVWLSSPKEFKGKNKIENLIVDQIQLGEPDESGRRRPEIKEGSEFNIKADMVIKALGFDPEDLPYLFDSKNLQVTKWGTIKADFDTMETNLKGVFAAGDIVRGASLVVWAIKDGRDAAAAMKTYLENIELKKSKVA